MKMDNLPRARLSTLVIIGCVLVGCLPTTLNTTRLKEVYPDFRRNAHMTDEQRLLSALMRDYDRHTRPVMNASHTVKVKLGITLNQIFDVEEKNQVLTTHIWLDQEWYDEKLRWVPEDFNGLKTLRVPCHLIWKPDIVLYNSADDYNEGYMPALAMVSHDGHIFWPPIAKLRSTCKIDITYFPFDDQLCLLKLGSWAYDGFQVDVHKRDKPIDLTNYVSNGEWELLNVQVLRNVQYYSCCPEPYPDVTFSLHMRRRTLYYTYNVIIPCIMLSSLTVLGFWMPPEGGEKVALGLTVLLAYSVFMLLIAENMPATSYYVPLIGVYIIVDMGLSSLSVMFAVMSSHMHHQSFMGREVPAYLRRLATTLNRWLMIKPRGKRNADSKAPSTTETTPDLKTPLRESLSSINCSFSHEGEMLETFACGNSEVVANARAVAVAHGSGGMVSTHAHSRSVDTGLCREAGYGHSGSVTEDAHTGGNASYHHTSGHAGTNTTTTSSIASSRKSKRKAESSSSSKRATAAAVAQYKTDELLKRLDLLLARQEEATKNKASEVNREWQEVAEVIDRALFYIYVFITFMTTVVILVFVPLGKSVTL